MTLEFFSPAFVQGAIWIYANQFIAERFIESRTSDLGLQ